MKKGTTISIKSIVSAILLLFCAVFLAITIVGLIGNINLDSVTAINSTISQTNEIKRTKKLNIENESDLKDFRDNVNNGTRYSDYTIYLKDDLNLGGVEWTPIGCGSSSCFSGAFNGGGHTISNFRIEEKYEVTDINNGKAAVGLFGKIGYGAEIHDLAVKYVTIQLNSDKNYCVTPGVGCLVGWVASYATVYNCSVKKIQAYL